MSNCDVCNGMTSWGSGTTYTADEFRTIVSMGFQPDHKVVMMGPAAVQGWKDGLVASSTTGWLLCPSCAIRAAKYLPKPSGTGPAGHKLAETMSIDQLLGGALPEQKVADIKSSEKPPSVIPKKPEIPQEAYQWAAVSGDERECPLCKETIKAEAKVCRYCDAEFDVEVRGYCTTDHDEVTLDDAGRCSRCGGEVLDRHIKTRVKIEEPLAEAQAPSISTPTAAPGISQPKITITSEPKKMERPGCVTTFAILLFTTSLLLLLSGVVGGFITLTTDMTDSAVTGGAIMFVISLAMGVPGIIVGRGLWLMKNWARIGAILILGVSMIFGLITILSTLFPTSTTEGAGANPTGIIFGSIVGLIIPGVIMVWFIRNKQHFQVPSQVVVTLEPQAPTPLVSEIPEIPPATTKPPEPIPAAPEPSVVSRESILDGLLPEGSRLVVEALEIIEGRVVEYMPGWISKIGGDASEAMTAAEKLAEAHQLQPEEPWLHYAWASALHLAMQYETGREEMERLAQTHPEFLLATFAIEGWDQWQGLFTLPPWNPGIESVLPAISAEVKAAFVLGTRQGLQPRATLFLRDVGGEFTNSSVLQTARIDITTVLSSNDPQIAVVYARIWDNPDSPYQVEALGLPLYPRGSKLRCKYEYLCLQDDIDFAVLDNNDRILLNKRLAIPKRMRETHQNLLKLLRSSPGREITDTEIVTAVRSFQDQFSLSDVRY